MTDLESVLEEMQEGLGDFKFFSKFQRYHPQWRVLALAMDRAGKFEKSLLIWQKIIDHEPSNLQSYVHLAYAQFRNDKISDALSTTKKAILLFPDSVFAHYTRFDLLNDLSKRNGNPLAAKESDIALQESAFLASSGYCKTDDDYSCGVKSLLAVSPSCLPDLFDDWAQNNGLDGVHYWASKGLMHLYQAQQFDGRNARKYVMNLKSAARYYSRAAKIDSDDPILAKTLAEIAQRLGNEKMYGFWSGCRDARAIDYFTTAKALKKMLM